MQKAKLESREALYDLRTQIDDIESNMRENLSLLQNAFEAAAEHWNDNNAKVCREVLIEHSDYMRKAFGRLEDFESTLDYLGELAYKYENI